MTKEAYYFSHDSNAHKDPKCIRLRRLAGLEGYGLFWCLIEMLRDAPENKIELGMVDDILFELRAEQKTLSAIFEAGLLVRDDVFFWSESLCKRMALYGEIVEARSRAGKASAQKKAEAKALEFSTHVQQEFNTCSTHVQQDGNTPSTEINKGKERKGKETKEKTSFDPDAFLSECAQQDRYLAVDVKHEKIKMIAWLEEHPKRKMSKAFIINWLDKAAKDAGPALDEYGWPIPSDAETARVQAEVEETTKKMIALGYYHQDGTPLTFEERMKLDRERQQAKRNS